MLTLWPGLHPTLMADAPPQYVQQDPSYTEAPPLRSERNVYRHATLVERLNHKLSLLRAAAGNGTSGDFPRRAVRGAIVFGVVLAIAAFLYFIAVHTQKGQPQFGESERDARERALLCRVGVGGLYAAALLSAVAWVNRGGYANVLWLFLPALAFLTTLIASFVLHLVLPRFNLVKAWNRSVRSLWGAFQAMTWYAFLTALLLALFPLATYAFRDAWGTVGFSGAFSLLIARALTSRTDPPAGGRCRPRCAGFCSVRPSPPASC